MANLSWLELSIDVEAALDTLPPRTAYLLTERYKLCGHGSPTLADLGEVLRITSSRVYQIEQKGIRKIQEYFWGHDTSVREVQPFEARLKVNCPYRRRKTISSCAPGTCQYCDAYWSKAEKEGRWSPEEGWLIRG